jgi:15-cis-phytoene synthase
MTAPSPAFATFEQKWLAEYPENALVAVFLPPGLRTRASAFGTLIHELTHTAFRVRETPVAAAKLAWWQQELAAAARGNPRHPVTRALFAESPVGPAEIWPALAGAAIEQLEDAPAGSLAAIVDRLLPFHRAAAGAEAALFGVEVGSTDASALRWTISHLLRELSGDPDRLPVPLDLLARHGVGRADLGVPSAARAALVRDYIDTLARFAPAQKGKVTGTLPRRVRVRLDLALMRGAQSAADPLAYLQTRKPAGRWQTLWIAWREARAIASGR